MNVGTLVHGDDGDVRGVIWCLPTTGAVFLVEDVARYHVVEDLVMALRGKTVRNATNVLIAPDPDHEVGIRAAHPGVPVFYDPPLFERRMTVKRAAPGTPMKLDEMLDWCVFGQSKPPAPKIPTGWECPRCRAILAPHVDRCTCSTLDSSGPTATCR